MQESLGGNSRTTLIINCSPSSFNEAETMSTLRFGMRAKTIENKAKVNAELSPTELKAILKKSRIEISYLTSYAASLESEIKQWRSGSSVPESTWVSLNSKSEKTTVAIDSTEDSILELTKPTIPDEKEDFLKRENELSDQIEEKEIELKKTLKLLDAIKSDYAMLQDRDALFAKENQSLSAEINHLKLQIEKTSLEIKENCILNDSLKQENEDINVKLDQLRIELANNANKSPSPPNTPERLAEPAIKDTRNTRMSQMMAEFDPSNGLTEKEREMRKTLSKLSTIGDTSIVPSNPDDILKQHIKFKEANAKLKLQDQLIQELSAKAKQLDLVSQQNITLSSKLDSLEVEYEQLLNDNIEEEVMHADNPVLAAIEDIKTKLEKHYSVKSDLNEKENVNLRLELEKKEIELDSIIKKLDQISIERLEMMVFLFNLGFY